MKITNEEAKPVDVVLDFALRGGGLQSLDAVNRTVMLFQKLINDANTPELTQVVPGCSSGAVEAAPIEKKEDSADVQRESTF